LTREYKRGRALKLDRAKISKEPWEKSYKRVGRKVKKARRKMGLAGASKATRTRVARLGGKASAKARQKKRRVRRKR